jgi:hypothetical protein
MPFTFGGATGDDVSWTNQVVVGATNTSALAFGWWRPTTLTATRGLWSAGATVGAEIDATTDELRLRTDNTTDGQWTTAGVDMVVNEWIFLAFLLSANNTNGAAWRVWRATLNLPVTEATVSVATARSGNFTGSSSIVVGNKGTAGTLAFQGDIAGFGVYSTTATASENHPLAVSSYGTAFTQAQADLVRDRLVIPAYEGRLSSVMSAHAFNAASTQFVYWRADVASAQAMQRATASGSTFTTLTLNGATVSGSAHPRPVLAGPWVDQFAPVLTANL